MGSERDHSKEDQNGEICGYPGQRGPCQNQPTEGERCWIESHTESIEDQPHKASDGRAAPEGNDHAVGNPGGGPPEGNTNAMVHGLEMTVERLAESFDEQQREEMKSLYLHYQDKVLNKNRALKLAIYEVMETTLLRDLAEEDMHEWVQTGEAPEEGYERFMQEKTEAVLSYGREIRLGLHYEGNSAQHQGGSSGHDNLDALIQDGG